MEAVPKLPMISFDLKTSEEKPNFYHKLKDYIENHYNEDGESFRNELSQLEGLRASAARPTLDVAGCATLKRYYAQLHFLLNRFPMKKGGDAAVSFSWRDAYRDVTVTGSDVTIEQAALLHNIGALHTQLGAETERTDSDALRLVCTHYQCAAWAFQHITSEYPQVVSYDPSSLLLNFFNVACLAQAQECILEKALLDNRKAGLVAKISAQTVEFCRQALNLLTSSTNDEDVSMSDLVGSKTKKRWEAFLRFKQTFYACVTLLYQGQQAEEEQKMGERVGYYQAAVDKLDEAVKLAGNVESGCRDRVNDTLTFTRDVLLGKRKNAQNENEFIYHEEVPAANTLPAAVPAVLVKGVGFEVTDGEISGPDIFIRLIPLTAHESSSIYSEQLAGMLRNVTSDVMAADHELDAILQSIHVNQGQGDEDDGSLPQSLIDRCAGMSAKPDAIKNLLGVMDSLSETYQDVEAMLLQINALLQKEDRDAQGYEDVVGSRPPSIAATDLTREANKYKDAHAKASESNATLHKAMEIHIANLRLLMMPIRELEQKLPKPEEPSAEDAQVLNKMGMLMEKVREMRTQRGVLVAQLREDINRDDITKKIVILQQLDQQTFFQYEMAKHEPQINLIKQNMAAQENILKAVQDTYALYGQTRRNINARSQRREAMVASLAASYDAYEDLITKSNKGLEFYNKLHANVSKLLQRVRSTCKVQEEEREQVLSTILQDVPKRNNELSTVNASVDLPERIYNDTGSGGGLKLKDYLNMKKETGRMSLVPAAPTWVPGVRPAPLGSETQEAAPLPPADALPYDSAMDKYPEKNSFSQSMAEAYPAYHANPPHFPNPAYAPYGYATSLASQPQPAYMPAASSAQSYSNVASNMNNIPASQPHPQSNFNSHSMSTAYNQMPVVSYGGQQQFPQERIQTSLPSSSSQPYQYPQASTTTTLVYNQLQQPVAPSQYNQQLMSTPQVPQAPSNEFSRGYQQPSSTHGYNLTPVSAPHDFQQPMSSVNAYQKHSNSPGQGYSQQVPQAYQQSIAFDQGYNQASITAPQKYQQPSSNAGTQPNPAAMSIPQDYRHHQAMSGSQASQGYSQPSLHGPNIAPQPYNQQLTTPQGPIASSAGIALPSVAAPLNSSSIQPISAYQGGIPISYQQQPSISSHQNSISGTSSVSQPTSSSTISTTESAFGQSSSINLSSNIFQNATDFTKPAPNALGSGLGMYGQEMWTGGYTPQQTPGYQQMVRPFDSASLYTQTPQPNSYPPISSGAYVPSTTPSHPTSLPISNQPDPSGYSWYAEYQASTQSPVTYKQAGYIVDKNTTTTNTTDASKLSTSSEKPAVTPTRQSHVDLLAGLHITPVIPDTRQPEESIPSKRGNNELMEEKCEPEVTRWKARAWTAETLTSLIPHVDKLAAFVASLPVKSLNGPTALDLKWKEIVDAQERDASTRSISVARCYPSKNRCPDILPYDESRVLLNNGKDDYINASLLKELSEGSGISIILTQTPLPSTCSEFWTMVLEKSVELVVCLQCDEELGAAVYWPTTNQRPLCLSNVKVSLQSFQQKESWTERVICVTNGVSTRVVMHLQFTQWPQNSFPPTPMSLVGFVDQVQTCLQQQRSPAHPAVLQCFSGVGPSGLVTALLGCMLHLDLSGSVPDIVAVVTRISQARKNCLRDREHFKFLYECVLCACQHVLDKNGMTSGGAVREVAPVPTLQQLSLTPSAALVDLSKLSTESTGKRKAKFLPENFTHGGAGSLVGAQSSADPLSSLDPLWSLKK